jgi:hypothetical protein
MVLILRIGVRSKTDVASNGTEQAPEKNVRRRIPKWALQTGEASAPDDQYYMRSIGRALEVLNCFDGQVPLSLKDLGARTELPE